MIAVLSKILGSGDVIKKGLDLIDDITHLQKKRLRQSQKPRLT